MEDEIILDTYHVQRLKAPPKSDLEARATQVFAFGGGGSGMSEKAWKIIQQAFGFEYMGAAEFEFGAPAICFARVHDNYRDYEIWEFVIPAKDIKPHYRRESILNVLRKKEIADAKAKGEKPPRMSTKRLIELAKQNPITDKTIYVMGQHKLKDAITDMIRRIGTGKPYTTKNGHQFDTALDFLPGYDGHVPTLGWMDIDNNVFWFTDKKMRDMTAYIFGVVDEAWMKTQYPEMNSHIDLPGPKPSEESKLPPTDGSYDTGAEPQVGASKEK